jgi:Ser/Thr protein kinase RdoA (MazF antagonist)
MLEQSGVAEYLLKHGLINGEYVVSRNLTVTDLSRRNSVFAVAAEGGSSFIVKQAAFRAYGSLSREVAAYEILATIDCPPATYLPRVDMYERDQDILVIELRERARNLASYHDFRGRFPARVAARIGALLSAVHSDTRTYSGVSMSDYKPWILSIAVPDLPFFLEASSANVELMRIIQQSPELGQAIHDLGGRWSSQCLVHNDLKWDNCVVSPGQGGSHVAFVDWEFAGQGDPCWDVGTILGAYLSCWLWSIPIFGNEISSSLPRLAGAQLTSMQPAMRSFIDAYLGRMSSAVDLDEWYSRVVGYAAARLLQSAFEDLQSSVALTPHAVCAAQLSLNMFRDPSRAGSTLLGIGAPQGTPRINEALT